MPPARWPAQSIPTRSLFIALGSAPLPADRRAGCMCRRAGQGSAGQAPPPQLCPRPAVTNALVLWLWPTTCFMPCLCPRNASVMLVSLHGCSAVRQSLASFTVARQAVKHPIFPCMFHLFTLQMNLKIQCAVWPMIYLHHSQFWHVTLAVNGVSSFFAWSAFVDRCTAWWLYSWTSTRDIVPVGCQPIHKQYWSLATEKMKTAWHFVHISQYL